MDSKLENTNNELAENVSNEVKPATSQIPGELSFSDYTKCRTQKNCNYLDCPYRRDMFMFN